MHGAEGYRTVDEGIAGCLDDVDVVYAAGKAKARRVVSARVLTSRLPGWAGVCRLRPLLACAICRCISHLERVAPARRCGIFGMAQTRSDANF